MQGHHSPAHLAVVKARIAMLAQYPFFGSLGLKLKLQEAPGLQVPMATDGTSLKFNDMVLTDSPDELMARVAGCVLRCMAGHPWRKGSREDDFWQASGEFAITPMLVRDGMKLPADMLYDPQYAGHSAEMVYQKIYYGRPKNPEGPPEGEQGRGKGQGEGEGEGEGDKDGQEGPQSPPQPPKAGTQAEDAPEPPQPSTGSTEDSEPPPQTEQDWQLSTLQAEMFANKRGDGPGAARQILDNLKTSKVPWQDLLRRFVQESAKTDHDWSRPNMRYIQAGIYLPTLHSHKMGKIVQFTDSSGSVWGVLDRFGAQMQTIMEDCQPEKLVVVYWDTVFQGREDFEPGDELKLRPRGGGGTNFRGCWHWLEQQEDLQDAACIVFLTDLETTFAENEPDKPLLWAVTGRRRRVPYGEVVVIDPE